MWTIYVTNDNCPDYTWGLSEEATRKAFADVVRGHLDEMARTDKEPPESQDRYNAAVTQEVLCFVEHYPQRKDELIRRIQSGRLYVSPYLCNSLWAFQGVEGAIRTFYPARRLERDWGIRCFDVAEHIEEPSLPWGVAPILAGCGVRWLSNPFYNYDSTFNGLKNPPLFTWEGPDGSQVRVVMDPFASNGASYTQGAKLLREPKAIPGWLGHYAKLGDAYRTRAVLASGTHGDIAPGSGGQAREFAEKIIAHNKQPGPRPKLVNATLPQFCKAVDADQAKTPFLPAVRGCFGHSWDVWPVCLAKTVADMREGERQFLAAEALIAMASLRDPKLAEATRADRERAEWCLAMLSDHAWNGTDARNKRHNADLRRAWAQELNALALKLREQAWAASGLREARDEHVLFNPLSFPRRGLVRLQGVNQHVRTWQAIYEDGTDTLYFVSGMVPAFGLGEARAQPPSQASSDLFLALPTKLEGPDYLLRLDPETGGIASLIHKPSGRELVASGQGGTLLQSVYYDGQERRLTDVRCEVVGVGPVLARMRISGRAPGVEVTSFVTVYAELDRVDFDIRVKKPTTTKQERLCQFFPLLGDGAVVRIETTGAVIRPKPQRGGAGVPPAIPAAGKMPAPLADPEGDLLPGADTRRFAVQGFLDVSLPDGPGVTIAPLDAFVLRTDLGPLAVECLGNDQNYREVVQDQGGVTEFRFRYSLRAHKGPYDQAEAMAWSRSVATPLLIARGTLGGSATVGGVSTPREILVDPARAIATCLKPADDPSTSLGAGPKAGGLILRVWETAGRAEPLAISARGFSKAIRTDLLERDQEELKIADGKLSLPIRPHGFAAVRLVP